MRRRPEVEPGRRSAGRGAVLFVLSLCAVLGVCAGCASTGDQSAADWSARRVGSWTTDEPVLPPQPGGKLAVGLVAETDGWSPTRNRWAASGLDVSNAIFDHLTAFDEDGNAQPFLARSVEPNPTFTEWTIKLREGVIFHNGQPLDADAVKANLVAARDSALTGGALKPIRTDDTGIVVVDPMTVKVSLSSMWSTFPNVLTGQLGAMAAPAMLNDPNGSFKPIGTGPFVFDSWTPDAKLKVRKNRHYWQPGYPLLDEIEFQPIPDNQSRAAALRADDIDVIENQNPATVESFRSGDSSGDYRILSDPQGEDDEAFVMLNLARPPFDDPVARRALAHATDKNSIVDRTAPGYEPADGAYTKSSRWYTDTGYPAFDPDQARRDVDDYKSRHDGTFTVDLVGIPVVEVESIEQQLEQQWKDVGIDVRISNVDESTLIANALNGAYQAVMWRHFNGLTPDSEYQWWVSSNAVPPGQGPALNFPRNRDPEIDAALDRARTTRDFAEQKKQYDIVQRRLSEDLPYIWLYHLQSQVIASPRVHDLTRWQLPDNGPPGRRLIGVVHPWYQVWLEH